MRYFYIKEPASILPARKQPTFFKKVWFWTVLPVVLMAVGFYLLASAALPIVSYQLFVSPRFRQVEFIKPVAGDVLLAQPAETFTPMVLGEEESAAFLDIDQWFPAAPKIEGRVTKITHYTLSIPRLKIENAVVEIGGLDIKKKLIQYPGTANPGQPGNAVIFGHSVLPQFFNPKNYLTIFSTLPMLKSGDEILVNFDGVVYKYQVEQMIEVSPDDISVLEQRYNDSYLTLITCVPPGTYLRRLVVRARLAAK